MVVPLFGNSQHLWKYSYLCAERTEVKTKKIIWLLTIFFCRGLNKISGLSKGRNGCVYIQLLFHISFIFHPCSYCEPIPSMPNYLVFPQDSCFLQRHVFKCILSISSPWEMTPSITPSACQSLPVWPRKWELQMVSSIDDEARMAAMAGN